MGILGYRDTVHGVPDSRAVMIYKVPGNFTARAFLTTDINHVKGYCFYLLEGCRDGILFVALIPSIDSSTLLAVERPRIFHGFSLVDTIANGVFLQSILRVAGNGDFARLVTINGHRAEYASSDNTSLVILIERTNQDFHLMQCTLYSVLLQRTTLTATVTSQSVHLAIQMQIGAVALGELIRMLGKRHLQGTPGKCRGAHGTQFAYEQQTRAFIISQRTPAYILSVTHTLGLGKVHKLLLNRTFIKANKRAALSVVVVVQRSPSVIGVLVELTWQLHLVTQPGQRQIRITRNDAACQHNGTIGIDNVGLRGNKGDDLLFCLPEGRNIRNTLVGLTGLARTILDSTPAFSLTHHSISDTDRTLGSFFYTGFSDSLMLQIIQPLLEPLVASPVVVIHRSTEGRQLQGRIP